MAQERTGIVVGTNSGRVRALIFLFRGAGTPGSLVLSLFFRVESKFGLGQGCLEDVTGLSTRKHQISSCPTGWKQEEFSTKSRIDRVIKNFKIGHGGGL